MPDNILPAMVAMGAMLLAPSVLALLPSIDPLFVIMGLFALLALAQQAGLTGGDESAVPESARTRRGQSSEKQEAEEREPSVSELLEDAERCMKQNSYQAAQDIAAKAADKDPECSRAWELQASALKWLGQRKEAAALLRKAIDLYEVDSPGVQALLKELESGASPLATATECESKCEELFGKRQYDLALECSNKGLEALGVSATSSSSSQSETADERSVRLRLL
eukprot:CAMPEP_0178441256 /NCGR_PEP_ID=MMETSP0689_2-20121128/37371_1 /TAXON_ID=160604 /ORGANISM="Amphidinium massartii, Strain CS-259" /LENGTH=224 /DNA_ID=CAMNT_0020064397 /DNA_START=16 /DNA_END=686 /DNA_ORIENTATION=+